MLLQVTFIPMTICPAPASDKAKHIALAATQAAAYRAAVVIPGKNECDRLTSPPIQPLVITQLSTHPPLSWAAWPWMVTTAVDVVSNQFLNILPLIPYNDVGVMRLRFSGGNADGGMSAGTRCSCNND